MKKVFRKLFSHSSTDGVSEKSFRKFSTARNRVSVPNLRNQINQTKSNTAPTDNLPTSLSTGQDEERITYVDRRRNELIAASLHAAVSEGNAELVEQLLAQGADAETVDKNGLTPFLKAVKMGNVQLVNILVQRNKFQTDTHGNTALHIAVSEEFLRIAEILVAQDPLVNVPNKVGDLPLHVAVSKECFSIVELLLRNKAIMDVEDSQKRTPLFIALKLENVPLIQLLLNYGAHKNDHSIVTCLPTVRNPKIKIMFRFLDYKEKASTSLANDDDSQNSELCTLPPALDSPRSWNILHPKRNNKSHNAGENITNLLPQKRRKHLNKVADRSIGDPFENSSYLNDKKSDSLAVDERVIEDCKKALIELSLNVSQNENHDTLDKLNGATRSDTISLRNSVLLDETESFENRESKDDQNQNYLHKDTQSFVKFRNEYSSSSDDEPLMWENSNDGGYFTEWSRSSKLSDGHEIDNSKSSTSDEDLDNFHQDRVYSAMLTSLKQVTQDNKDLETESAVLRESVEKLKYDLANSKEDVDTEKINSLSLMSHLADFDEKYLKAVENVGTSQLYISNLEKEISHLKRTYNESCKMNRFLAKELRKTLADIASVKSMKCRICESRSIEIDELRAKIAEWKTKYDDLTQLYVGTNSSNFYQETKSNIDPIDETVNDIMKQKLLLEVSKLTSIIKDKEVKEEQLRNQVHELRKEIHKSKSEKRSMLIKKTFHDKYSASGTKKNTKDAPANLDFDWK